MTYSHTHTGVSMLKMKFSIVFYFKNKLKNRAFYHFPHTPDVSANVSRQILHSVPEFYMLFL